MEHTEFPEIFSAFMGNGKPVAAARELEQPSLGEQQEYWTPRVDEKIWMGKTVSCLPSPGHHKKVVFQPFPVMGGFTHISTFTFFWCYPLLTTISHH